MPHAPRSSSRRSAILLFACLAAALPACGALDDDGVGTSAGYATTCMSTTFEAENMTHSTGGPITGGWNIWSNGNISTTNDFFPGSNRIDVVAAGTSAGGVWPHMVVSVNGQQIGQTNVTSTAFQTFSFTFNAASGPQTLAVAFDNDAIINGEDRNLLVDKVTVVCTASSTGSGGAGGAAGSGAGGSGGATAGTGTGLRGDYFNNKTLTAPAAFSRTDATVNFNWGSGSPGSPIGADNFSVRWTGQVQPQFSQAYTFFTTSDDGVRLTVNGQQIINNWTDHAPTENSGTIALTAGQKYALTLEYYESGGGAQISLSWSSSSQAKQIIPSTQLYPASSGGGTGGTGGSAGTGGTGGTGGSAGAGGGPPLATGSGSTCDTFGRLAAGNYFVQNNAWNAGGQTQCISMTNGAVTVTQASFNLATNGPPASYPSYVFGCHFGNCSPSSGLPKQVSQITSAPSTFAVTPAAGAWDLAYDIWLDTSGNTTGQNNGAEIMIWLNAQNGANPAGSIVASNVSIGGNTFNLFKTTMNGSGVTWTYLAYRSTTALGSISVDVKAFIQDAINRGFAQSSWFLTSIQAGTEIWQGGTGLKLNSFSAGIR